MNGRRDWMNSAADVLTLFVMLEPFVRPLPEQALAAPPECHLVKDIQTVDSLDLSEFTVLDGTAFFAVDDGLPGNELRALPRSHCPYLPTVQRSY